MNATFMQSAILADDADQIRRAKIKTLFPPVAFLDSSFVPSSLTFVNPQTITNALSMVNVLSFFRCLRQG